MQMKSRLCESVLLESERGIIQNRRKEQTKHFQGWDIPLTPLFLATVTSIARVLRGKTHNFKICYIFAMIFPRS